MWVVDTQSSARARPDGRPPARLGRLARLGLLALGLYLAAAVVVASPRCAVERPADAIVVLGAAVWPGERPSPALARRIERGVELFHAGHAPNLVPTGGLGRNPPAEAEAMARAARARGVPAEALVLEDRATSTVESAEYVAALAERNGWRSVIVVSEPYHVTRAGWMFRDRGLDVQTACAAWGPEASWRVYQTLREVGGLIVYGLTGTG
jgi:uncharacterized SAM-binding protein YcdF (DUF218 family)